MKFFLLQILFLPLIFTGCLINREYSSITQVSDLSSPTKSLVKDMQREILAYIPRTKAHVYVTDFVNLDNLEVTSNLAYLLSSDVKTHLSKLCFVPIKEIEYSRYLKLSEYGTNVLSRNTNEIALKDIKKTFIFVGTYALTEKQLILYLKLINMKTGNIIKMSSQRIGLSDELISLEKGKEKPIIRPHLVL